MRDGARAGLGRVLALALALGGAAGASSQGFDPEHWKERGARVLAPFQQALQQALAEGLAKGPAEAVSVCRLRAPQLAAGAAEEAGPGVRVGRTSHRLRNPDNAPEPWMEPLLAAYRDAEGEARAPRAVPLPGGGVGYVEPIFVKPPCLTCHGETLAPSVAERIHALYPEDRATGFRVGDFRGLFWVAFPPEAAGPERS